MSRTSSHITETISRQIFESVITDFGDMLFRTVSERDYGIDGLVELFAGEGTTGRIAHIQLKGTTKRIVSLQNTEEISCPNITKSNLGYCQQNNVPVMLVYVSIPDEKFYYIDLQSVVNLRINDFDNQKTITVRIPMENNSDHMDSFVSIINGYYDRPNNGKDITTDINGNCDIDKSIIIAKGVEDSVVGNASGQNTNIRIHTDIVEWLGKMLKLGDRVSLQLENSLRQGNPEVRFEKYKFYFETLSEMSSEYRNNKIRYETYLKLIDLSDECSTVFATIENYINDIKMVGEKYLHESDTRNSLNENNKLFLGFKTKIEKIQSKY